MLCLATFSTISRLPGMSDAARKRTIADWVVKTKKQVVKLYAVVRWARDAGEVQKAMASTLKCRRCIALTIILEYHCLSYGPESAISGRHQCHNSSEGKPSARKVRILPL